MVQYENECVNCGFPCIGNACRHKEVPHYYCDECGNEEQLYFFDAEELCINCIKLRLAQVF